MMLLVDGDSLVKLFSKVLPRSAVDMMLVRYVYKLKMMHNPDGIIVLSTDTPPPLPFNNTHKESKSIQEIIEKNGVGKDWIILSANPNILGLSFYKLTCYEPSEDWLEPVEITHGRLKKRLGYDPRDHDIIKNMTRSSNTEENKRQTAAVGRTRKERWSWIEPWLEGGTPEHNYTKIIDNVHIKVGRTGFQNYEVIQDLPRFAAMLEKVDDLGWDTETNGLNWQRNLVVGESFSFDGKHGFYLPMRHTAKSQFVNVNPKQVEDIIHPLLHSKKLRGANLGFDVLMCAEHGLGFPKELYDIQAFAYMLGRHVPNPSALGLKALSASELGDAMTEYSSVAKGDTFDKVPIEKAASYAADDAVKSYRLIDHFTPLLTDKQIKRYEEIYKPLLYSCIRMSFNGMYMDLEELNKLLTTLEFERDLCESHIIAYAGHEFNVNSVPQLQEVLFKELQLPPTSLTKSGKPSTGSEHLERISDTHPIIEEIIKYRELSKLINTYLVGYTEYVGTDGRIHSSINPFKVITGRLSSTNPNLMNIPVRSELGRKIRMLFRSQAQDEVLLSADASQLEYRMLAHYSNNQDLINTFNDPTRDIHKTMASLIFNKEEGEITHSERDYAKTAFYAILYGASPARIARTLNIPINEAATIIGKIKTNIPEIEQLKRAVLTEAKQDGYVPSYLGHRSYIYGLFSRNSAERESAERSAFDALFQGTASGDITALATIRTQELLDQLYPVETYGLHPPVILVQQIHDELLLEGKQEDLEAVAGQIINIFANTIPTLKVPVVAKYSIGTRWGDIH